ncbi:enoyl-[acyl-carrier protein] reductase III [Streptomyces sp. yr375]|uniref:SDR family oxidoreductase n=1 Tax=Streptomyces sp. yr375 TaxID=1761906 RepID=UPI0008D81849|nr:SDR family oxidoreductase [Streptomyces sp. yr375]SER47971.1 enoyl-[acyl-carrier protein] reductase III [Streptomyces sp. yr375]
MDTEKDSERDTEKDMATEQETDIPPLTYGPGGDRPFAGAVALVTGGTKGIGGGIARRLAALGSDVAVTYLRDRASADKKVAELRELGVRACARRAFFGDPQGDVPAAVVDWVTAELGPPTLLVSNAGTGVELSLLDTRRSHWDWTVETHARSLLRLVQCAPELRAVLAVSSPGAHRVMPHAYGLLAASKAAQESLVRYLAVELAPRCRVNAVTPGLVDTDAARSFGRHAELFETARARTPAGRLTLPQDVGAVAAFLLSDEARMITGQNLVIDGGYSILM